MYTTPSQFHLHVLHSSIVGHCWHPSNVVCWRICYLFIWNGAVYFECTSTCFSFNLSGIHLCVHSTMQTLPFCHHHSQASCWSNSKGDWLKVLGSQVWAAVVMLNNTRWVDSACHPSKVGKMGTRLLETGGTASAAVQLCSQQWCSKMKF